MWQTPTVSEGITSSATYLQRDYKSNAIAYRIAKKHIDSGFGRLLNS